MYDLIIIGAGPAGLTCALYAARANKKILVLEAKNYGGQIINANKIENYPALPDISGYDFATNLYNQVKKFTVEIKYETVIKIEEDKTVITNKNKYNSKAVVIATGVENKKMNINNEEKLIGKGVSYCATCDGNFYKNKTVAVIGGGNTALSDAIYLSSIASKVYLIHRRDTFKAEEIYVSNIKEKSNIELLLNSEVVNINGNEKLESIDVLTDEGQINIKVDGIFIAIGQQAKNKMFYNVADIDKLGYIISDDGVHTKTPGIYVAGDARQKVLRQLTTAVSDGSIAASVAIKEMKK